MNYSNARIVHLVKTYHLQSLKINPPPPEKKKKNFKKMKFKNYTGNI